MGEGRSPGWRDPAGDDGLTWRIGVAAILGPLCLLVGPILVFLHAPDTLVCGAAIYGAVSTIGQWLLVRHRAQQAERWATGWAVAVAGALAVAWALVEFRRVVGHGTTLDRDLVVAGVAGAMAGVLTIAAHGWLTRYQRSPLGPWVMATTPGLLLGLVAGALLDSVATALFGPAIGHTAINLASAALGALAFGPGVVVARRFLRRHAAAREAWLATYIFSPEGVVALVALRLRDAVVEGATSALVGTVVGSAAFEIVLASMRHPAPNLDLFAVSRGQVLLALGGALVGAFCYLLITGAALHDASRNDAS